MSWVLRLRAGAFGSDRFTAQLADLKREALVAGVLSLVRRWRPIHLSIVGGEPLVCYREPDILLPKLVYMGVEVQLFTSAVRPLPPAWRSLPNLRLAVSVDGLQPEHDRRRAPATYDRILKHIAAPSYQRALHDHKSVAPAPGLSEGFRRFLVKA